MQRLPKNFNFFKATKVITEHACCKNCKKHTECTHPKKMVLISGKKARTKSKCTKCLTDRTLFDKILKRV